MLDDEGLKFPASVVSSFGRNFVKTLTEVLWYIDGHQETVKKQSFSIPDRFLKFVGYNAPELVKHRKRQHTNLSVDVLNSLNLQASFWAGSPWQCIKKEVESSISNYATYLSAQNKKMTDIHSQSNQLSDSLNPLSENLPFLHIP